MTFQGKLAVVTGGNSGIGRAIALAFVKAGAEVVIIGRNPQKGADTLNQLTQHGRAHFYSVDLSNSDQIETCLQHHPQIDILVNNAGAGESRGGTVNVLREGQDSAEINARWQHLAGSNLQSTYLMSALAAPNLVDGAAVVNISSTASIHGNYGLYGTFKAGVEGLTRSLAVEFAPRNIRVNAISPGWIQTETTLLDENDPTQAAWATQTSLLGRMGQVDEIADVVLFLASPQASFVTGAVLTVDGGLSIIDPTANSWRDTRK